MDSLSLQEKIRDLVETQIEGLGFELVAVEWLGGSGAAILRLSIDRAAGVDASACAQVSRHLGTLLDAEDPIASGYRLEVSSPGINRPVQRRQDFERFQGYRVKLRLTEGPPRRRYTGVIGTIEEDDLLLQIDGSEHRIPLDLVERANLVLDLDEYQQLGEGRR